MEEKRSNGGMTGEGEVTGRERRNIDVQPSFDRRRSCNPHKRNFTHCKPDSSKLKPNLPTRPLGTEPHPKTQSEKTPCWRELKSQYQTLFVLK